MVTSGGIDMDRKEPHSEWVVSKEESFLAGVTKGFTSKANEKKASKMIAVKDSVRRVLK